VNKSTFGGIALALGGIGLGLFLDGGQIGQLLQPTAALIVFGGTLGAVMVQFPFALIMQAGRHLVDVFVGSEEPAAKSIDMLTRFAYRARRDGMLSLESELDAVADPFLKKSLTLAVDGTHPAELRRMMELQSDVQADREDMIPKVFEAAGGFAPTIGILGAVIGLIQVMQRLSNINEVGRGIAVAFVATIYGVGSANILFLPCAGRIKMLIRRKQLMREMMLDGVMAILEGVNPRALEAKLGGYLSGTTAERTEKLVLK
jgi:chemotaxis protein MotA